MKKHLEKLQREIQETRSSKSDKERQLNQERTRIQVRREKFLIWRNNVELVAQIKLMELSRKLAASGRGSAGLKNACKRL